MSLMPKVSNNRFEHFQVHQQTCSDKLQRLGRLTKAGTIVHTRDNQRAT